MRSAAATVAERGADLIDLNMGCPVPKVCKTGAGAALIKDPDTAVAVARAAREGSGPAGHRQAALGPAPGRDRRLRRSPTASSHEAGVARSASTRAAPRCTTRARPTTTSPRGSSQSLDAPVILTGGLSTAQRRARAPTSAPAPPRSCSPAASLGNPWLFAQLLGTRADGADATTRSWPSSTGSWTAPSSTSAPTARGRYLRKFYPWYVEPHRRAQGAAAGRCSRPRAVAEARAVLAGLRRRRRGLSGAILPRSLPSQRRLRPPRPRAGFSCSAACSRAHQATMPKDVILTPEGLKAPATSSRAADHQAPRGRRAHQGGARVRRHLGELRVRRRQERADDARAADRPARGAPALGAGRRRLATSRPTPSRSARSSTSRTRRRASREVHDRRLGRGQPGGEQALQRVAGRQGAARATSAATTVDGPAPQRPEAQAQDHQDRRRVRAAMAEEKAPSSSPRGGRSSSASAPTGSSRSRTPSPA